MTIPYALNIASHSRRICNPTAFPACHQEDHSRPLFGNLGQRRGRRHRSVGLSFFRRFYIITFGYSYSRLHSCGMVYPFPSMGTGVRARFPHWRRSASTKTCFRLVAHARAGRNERVLGPLVFPKGAKSRQRHRFLCNKVRHRLCMLQGISDNLWKRVQPSSTRQLLLASHSSFGHIVDQVS